LYFALYVAVPAIADAHWSFRLPIQVQRQARKIGHANPDQAVNRNRRATELGISGKWPLEPSGSGGTDDQVS
jgi:hypothetical protein